MSEHSEDPQFTERHDGQQSSDAANWSGIESRARKKRNSGPRAKSGNTAKLPAVTPADNDQQHLMIAEAAYYRAEKRGFTEGYSLDDWLFAEAEIKGVHSS